MNTDGHRWRKEIRKLFLGVSVGLLVYAATYAVNSFSGGYWLVPQMDGHDRYSFGLAMRTAIMWQPQIGHEAIGDWNFVGAFYRPAIRLDREFVHPTIYLSDKDFDQKFSSLKISQVHPHWRDEFSTQVTATASKDETAKVLHCSFNYSGSDFPREISEIKMLRALADSLGVSPPNGFVEKPYGDPGQVFMTNYVHWVGRLPLQKNQSVSLEIPVQQFSSSSGKIVFYYQRSDHPDDSRNLCSVELK